MAKLRFKMDKLGRVTIPSCIRKVLGLQKGAFVDAIYDDKEGKLIFCETPIVDISSSIEDILRVAESSSILNNKEYDNLKCLLSKLETEMCVEDLISYSNIRRK